LAVSGGGESAGAGRPVCFVMVRSRLSAAANGDHADVPCRLGRDRLHRGNHFDDRREFARIERCDRSIRNISRDGRRGRRHGGRGGPRCAGHGGMDAELASFVVRRDDAALVGRADNNGLPGGRGARGVRRRREGVHVTWRMEETDGDSPSGASCFGAEAS